MNAESLRTAFVVLLVGALISVVPALTLSTLQFGVRVPAERITAPVIVEERRRYFWRTGIATAVLTVLALVVATSTQWLTLILLLAELALALGCYFLARERIIAVKYSEDWFGGLRQAVATDTTWRTEPERFPMVWLVPAVLIIIATAVIGTLRYPMLPSPLAVHFLANGTANGYADKTIWSAFALVFTQIFVTGLLTGLLVLTFRRGRPEVDVADIARSTARYRRFLAMMSRTILVIAALVDLSLLLIALRIWQVYQPSGAATAMAVVPVVLGVAGLLVVVIRTGQAGSRLDHAAPVSGPTTNRDDDRFWKGGLIYVNRRDSAVIVPRRFGVGWTLNLGNPWAWLAFVVIIGGALALRLSIRH
jgi:uncharacterized membrane protein